MPVSALRLLAEAHNRKLLAELDADRFAPRQAHWALEELPEATRRGRLRRLETIGVIRPVVAGASAASEWELTPAGLELARIATLAQWLIGRVPALSELSPSGRERAVDDVLSALGDAQLLRIVCALADGGTRPADVERLVALSRSAVHARLRRLRRDGVVRQSVLSTMPRAVADELVSPWRRLAALVLLGMRWELRWARPWDPALTADLAALLTVIAPLALPPRAGEGTYELVQLDPAAVRPRIFVEVAEGGLRVCERPPARASRATLRGASLGWCETLIGGRPIGVRIAPADDGPARLLIGTLTRALFTGLPGVRLP